MEEKLQMLPIGVDDFKELRGHNYYYVDKSELISDILTQGSKVYFFTRPRRFGKSLNLSMLDAFFNIRYHGNAWFDGLKVDGHNEYSDDKNAHPVIYLKMKDLYLPDFTDFLSKMKELVFSVMYDFEYLHGDNRIPKALRDEYLETPVRMFDRAQLECSVERLCRMLTAYHGVKPIVLIDEYDNTINHAYGNDNFSDVLSFFRNFYSSILKSNDYLEFAVVTGVMQIAKESIFSGLNNFCVNNIFSYDFDERYGFTAKEVKMLCSNYGKPKKFTEAKKWYDGYRFGKAEIYNPWSILNYVQNGFMPAPYWAGTSGNDIVETLVVDADDETYSNLQILGNGEELEGMDVCPTVSLKDLGKRSDAIYSVLLMSGYLKAVPSRYGYNLSVPNKEMYGVFADTIVVSGLNESAQQFKNFFDAAEKGDVNKMEAAAFSVFAEHFQDWDLPDEGAYRRILVGAAMSRCGRFKVSSEVQSGNGRSDMIMERNSPSAPNIVIEFKKTNSDSEKDQLADAKEGLRQIKEREYFHKLKGKTLLYGISMRNKRAKVLKEVLFLTRTDR